MIQFPNEDPMALVNQSQDGCSINYPCLTEIKGPVAIPGPTEWSSCGMSRRHHLTTLPSNLWPLSSPSSTILSEPWGKGNTDVLFKAKHFSYCAFCPVFVLTSTLCMKTFLCHRLRAALIFGCKDRYLEASLTLYLKNLTTATTEKKKSPNPLINQIP